MADQQSKPESNALASISKGVIAASLTALGLSEPPATALDAPHDEGSTVIAAGVAAELGLLSRGRVFLLRKASEAGWHFSFHRSHRSHSSHRSSSTGRTRSRTTTPRAVAPVTYSLGQREIKLGAIGDDVVQLMNHLVRLGYLDTGKRNSLRMYSADVRQAVTAFQRDNGLSPDGICGRDTAARIIGAEPPSEPILDSVFPLKLGDSGKEVGQLMLALSKLRYLPQERLNADFIFTGYVDESVRLYQKHLEVAITGEVSEALFDRITSDAGK